MNTHDRLFERCKSYLLSQSLPACELKKSSPRAVTISREAGAGGVTIARLLADELESRTKNRSDSWAVFDRNLVERVLQDHHLTESLAKYMPEDSVPAVNDTVEEILGLHPSSWTLHRHTRLTILGLATKGNAIIVGRGANIITNNLTHVLHVRLIAPFDQRVKHAAAYYRLRHEEAERFVRRTDRARARYVRDHFHTSIEGPLQYHLVINTGRLPFQEVARIIADAVMELQGDSGIPHQTHGSLAATSTP